MVAQAIQRCGIALGPVLIPALASNPTGHFEDWDVVEMHDKILHAAGSNWLHIGTLPPVRERHLAVMRRLAADRDARYPAWAFKDPRACLFLEPWRAILPDIFVLGVLRHWAQCLDSLRDRAGLAIALAPAQARPFLVFWTDPTRALESWLVHTRALLDHARRFPARVRLLSQDSAMNPAVLHAILAGVPGLVPPAADTLGVQASLGERRTGAPDWIPPPLRAALDALWSECLVAVDAQPAAIAVDVDAAAGREPARPISATPSPTEFAATAPAEVPIETLARRADALIGRRDLESAERVVRECVARSPWVGEHHVRLGTCRLHQRRLDEAEIFILRGIALGPAKPYFWAQLASVCQHAGRDEEARQHLAKAMELDPAHPWFRIQSSQLEQAAGRFADSVGAARTAVELDPAIVVGHLRLIDALIRAGQFTNAEAALAAAKSRFPQDDEVARRETQVLWTAGRAAEARAQERRRMTANLAALAAGPASDDPRHRVVDPDQRADLESRIERALRGPAQAPRTE